ncbi:hypothetical protein [Leptospira harrisiae]|uniref:hypothetical protein n=1 Tax=Leptospira harrisiae TaxID=2023189 RepID=UPI000C2AB121|nr:hypothetical protein [Leptospira harrisiae]PKA09300.1 hypothetical protein CH366_06220 [Leptospira harrisiae]
MNDDELKKDNGFGNWIRAQAIRDLFMFDAIQDLIQSGDLTDSLKSFNDFKEFIEKGKLDPIVLESIDSAFSEYCKFKSNGIPKLSNSDFETIYQNFRVGQKSIKSAFDSINSMLMITDKLDIEVYEAFNRICEEMVDLNNHLIDLAHEKVNMDPSSKVSDIENQHNYPESVNRVHFDQTLLDVTKSVFGKGKMSF